MTTADQVAALATWAEGAGWRLRASGYSHNFAQARTILNTLDPARVFSSPLLDDLLP